MTFEAARLFSSWFGLILFWAFRPKNKQKLESYGSIPLRDDDDDKRVS